MTKTERKQLFELLNNFGSMTHHLVNLNEEMGKEYPNYEQLETAVYYINEYRNFMVDYFEANKKNIFTTDDENENK